MKKAALAALFFFTAVPHSAGQTVITGDAWVLGRVGVRGSAAGACPAGRADGYARRAGARAFRLSSEERLGPDGRWFLGRRP